MLLRAPGVYETWRIVKGVGGATRSAMRMTSFAAVLDAGFTAASEAQARKTQTLLIEALDYHLRSTRLAAPQHFAGACERALAERPSCLIVAGGSRSFRQAVAILRTRRAVPVAFLPGLHGAEWATHLWGGLPTEALVRALADGDVSSVPLDAGFIGGELFLGSVGGGFMSCLQNLRTDGDGESAFATAESFFARARWLGHCLRHPRVCVSCEGRERPGTLALNVALRRPGTEGVTPLRSGHALHVRMLRNRGLGSHYSAATRASAAGDWMSGQGVQHFVCSRLRIEGNGAHWLLLDGDPVLLHGPAEFSVAPGAVESFRFGVSMRRIANDNARSGRNSSTGVIVSFSEGRDARGRKKRTEKKR